MRKTDFANAFVAMLWLLMSTGGLQAMMHQRERHVAGHPAAGQWIVYVVAPALLLSLAAAAAILARRNRWFHDVYPAAVLLIAFALVPLLMVGGGGV